MDRQSCETFPKLGTRMQEVVMEFGSYLNLLRRGVIALVATVLAVVLIALAYLALAHRSYTSTTSILLTARSPQTISDQQQGAVLAEEFAATLAAVIDTPTVLDSVSTSMSPELPTSSLTGMVSAAARSQTSIIDITVTASSPTQAHEIADLTAQSAITVLPSLGFSSGTTSHANLAVSQISDAVLPSSPSSPNPQNVAVIATVLAIVLGIAAGIIAGALSSRVRRGTDLEQLGFGPVLAELAVDDADGTRELRSQLDAVANGKSSTIALVPTQNGALAAEIAIQLAKSYAKSGRRTALIDLDPWTGEVAAAVGIPAAPGIVELVANSVTIESVSFGAGLGDRLVVIPAGMAGPRQLELGGSPELRELVAAFEVAFDQVVLFCASLERPGESGVTAQLAGSAIIVQQPGRLDRRRQRGLLERSGISVSGFVLAYPANGPSSAVEFERPSQPRLT